MLCAASDHPPKREKRSRSSKWQALAEALSNDGAAQRKAILSGKGERIFGRLATFMMNVFVVGICGLSAAGGGMRNDDRNADRAAT